MNFIYSMTSPIIHIYFMRLISSEILAMANIITTALAAIVNVTIQSDKLRDIYRHNFLYIVLIDVICFIFINIESLTIPEIRYLGLAVLNAVSTVLWFTIISDAINHQIEGTTLTKWTSLNNTVKLIAALIGSLIAIVFNSTLEVEYCIILQCIANMIMGITDYKVYNAIKY